MWLYKLPEVVFQLFENDADVALLALFRLLRGSTKNFQYVVDSEFFDRTQRKKGNIDFACLSDGKVYIGEAKSNLTIDQEQFGFYESLVLRSKIDGVVFATSAPRWNPGLRTHKGRTRNTGLRLPLDPITTLAVGESGGLESGRPTFVRILVADDYSYYGPVVYRFADLGCLKDDGAGFCRWVITMGQDSNVQLRIV
jgi:hypothetical protein